LFKFLSICNLFQCSKLLADVNVIQFYPSKFVLITDILETFGESLFHFKPQKHEQNEYFQMLNHIKYIDAFRNGTVFTIQK